MTTDHVSRITHEPRKSSGHASRILVRGVNWLGDAVMSTPALLRLREGFPEAHIALLTPEKLRDLWRHHPAVNEIVALGTGEGLFSASRKLRAGSFDLALVLPNSPRAALEVWLAGIPQRIGYARPWRNWFLTQAVAPRAGSVEMRKRSVAEIKRLTAGNATPPASGIQYPASGTRHAVSTHHLHQYLHLAAALGANPDPLAPRLVVTPEEIETVTRKFDLSAASTNARPLFALNPGAEYGPAKRWPADRFIAAAREIQQRTNCVWLILGGKADTELAATIATGITHHASRITPPVNLAGRTSLRELMALLKLSRLLLTNDTGPMHVAAALGTPVVVPFGSTAPELTGPGLPGASFISSRSRRREEADKTEGVVNPPPHVGGYVVRHALLKSDVPCSPCFLRECPIDFRCMKGISVERVVEAVVAVVKTSNLEP